MFFNGHVARADPSKVIALLTNHIDERETAPAGHQLINRGELDQPIWSELPLDRRCIVEKHLQAWSSLVPIVAQPCSLPIHRRFLRDDCEDHVPTWCQLSVTVPGKLCAPVRIQEIDQSVAEDAVVLPAVVWHVCHRAVVDRDLEAKS